MTDSVIILSGGLDSATCLAVMIDNEYSAKKDYHALTFDYGQRHSNEIVSAINIAEHYGVRHSIVDMHMMGKLLRGSSLTSDIDVPEGHYASENMKSTVVPNRNAIMANIAIGVAVAEQARSIALGVHAGDHDVYPDCRPMFIEALEHLALVANEGFIHHKFEILAPFLRWRKSYIARTAGRLEVPIAMTWSCYKGGEKHCGRCATCVERQEAFWLADVEDPTEYEDSTYWKEATGC